VASLWCLGAKGLLRLLLDVPLVERSNHCFILFSPFDEEILQDNGFLFV